MGVRTTSQSLTADGTSASARSKHLQNLNAIVAGIDPTYFDVPISQVQAEASAISQDTGLSDSDKSDLNNAVSTLLGFLTAGKADVS